MALPTRVRVMFNVHVLVRPALSYLSLSWYLRTSLLEENTNQGSVLFFLPAKTSLDLAAWFPRFHSLKGDLYKSEADVDDSFSDSELFGVLFSFVQKLFMFSNNVCFHFHSEESVHKMAMKVLPGSFIRSRSMGGAGRNDGCKQSQRLALNNGLPKLTNLEEQIIIFLKKKIQGYV